MIFPRRPSVVPTHQSMRDNPHLTLTYSDDYWCYECERPGHKVDWRYTPNLSHPLDREAAYRDALLI